jgi:hypothetical protein
VRVYVGLTVPLLAELRDRGSLGPAPLTGFAVTPQLRESYSDGGVEELEYAALLGAGRFSLRQLDGDATAARRRVVIAADVADADLSWNADAGPAGVLVSSDIPLVHVVAVHIDDPAAAPTIAAAAAALGPADIGDDDAAFAVDEADGWELMWFATQEIDDILAS